MIKINKMDSCCVAICYVIILAFIVGIPALPGGLLGVGLRLLVIIATFWFSARIIRLVYIGEIISFSDLQPCDSFQHGFFLPKKGR